MIDLELKTYVEREILPRYDGFDPAHRRDHANMVIAQSLALAERLSAAGQRIDEDMCYVIAAYHDLGLCEGRERHHEVSARIIRRDGELRRRFTAEQIEVMADAAEDHRASSSHEPRTVYGRIVAEADRVIDPDLTIRRTVQYGLQHYADLSRDEHFARMMQHLEAKYGPDGYLRLYFAESPNAARLAALRGMMRDTDDMRRRFDALYDALTKFNALSEAFSAHADAVRAQGMSAYMRNQFAFYGLPTALRRMLSGELLRSERKSGVIDWLLIDLCWADAHREMQYFACDYLSAMRRYLCWDDVPRLRRLLVTKPWWDTIDGMDRLVGGIADDRIPDLMRAWSLDECMWLRRVAIDHQIGRKADTDTALLEKVIVNNLESKEFFINKAIGWSLRDYARTAPAWVRDFVGRHRAAMAPLSIREAMKHL